jgi:hypothetical protein
MSPEERMAAAILKFDEDPILKKPQYCIFKGHDAFREAVIAAKLYLDERDNAAGHAEPEGSCGAPGPHRGLLAQPRLRRDR